jgi:GntR family transcriptional regulator
VVGSKIQPGDPLPSIRQLANDLELNSKTVAKAYKLLERDLVIQSKGYRGTFVHPDAKTNSTVDLNAEVLSHLNSAITACKTAGVTDSEIRIAFNNAMNSKNN